MKKILLGILAFAAVACNNDVVISEQTSSAITFGDSFVEVKTRATEDPSTTTATINAFDVWAFINNDPAGTVFNQERVKRVDGVWEYTNTQWWAQSKNYDFFAVSPVDDANIDVDNSTMNQYGLGNIAFTNVDGTTDLLYSALELETTQEFPYYNDAVRLQFMHLLSKIKFTFKNGFTSENQTLKVTNIMIEDAPAEGNVDVNKQQRTDYAWVLTQGKTTELSFGYANDDVAIACGQSGSSQYERLTIPADANRTYKISFDLELFNGTQSGMTSHKEVTLTNQAFEIGKNYNLVATIDASNFYEEALNPIVFDDIIVEDWVENDFNGNLDYDNDQNNPSNPSNPSVTPGENSEWALVGAFSSWTDKTMLTTADADVVVLEDVALKAAEGFLVRKPSTDWADKYGAGNVNYLKANHYITSVKEGADMCVEADGTYDVYFNISTKNLYVMEADANYAEATEQTVNGEEPKQEEPEVTEKVVYLKPNANWTTDGARFAAYFFGGSTGEQWVSMTAIEDGIYQVNLPEGYDYGCNVIFCRMNPSTTANNWNNKWNQTGDLTIPTDGKNLFTLAESAAWDGATASWSVYTPAVAPTPVALATPVVIATVDVNVITLKWEAIEGASHYTVQVDDDVEEVVNDTTYTFEGDYEFEYTFTVKAIAADTTKNLDSEAAVVTATTKAKPVVEPEVLAELDADAYYIYKQATEMKGGKWYAIVYENKAATGVTGNYGYLKVTEATSRANGISLPATCAFGFLTTDGGYTIQQFDGKYVYQTGTYDSFNVNANLPADGGVWGVAVNGNEYTITNNTMSKFVQYDSAYNSYGCYATVKGSLPTLYELVEVDNTPAILGVSPSSLSFAADGESKTITVSTYGVATLTVNESADWVSTSKAENIVTVTVDANTGEARETTLTLSYGDDSQVVTIAQVAPSTGEIYTVTYDFTQIDGFSSWTSSYSEHTVEYNEATVCFEKANRQSGTITNMPVTKGYSVTLVAKNNATITAAAFECQQWGTKTQTITLYYSTDGGNTYTSTNIKSTNFSIESSTLPEGTNAVKIGFSSTSNQVGIKSATITYK